MLNLNGILRGLQPDLRDVIMDLAKEGWRPSKTNGGHIRLDHPEAAKPVFAPSTPGDFRTRDNLLRDCRGALRPLQVCNRGSLSKEEALSSLQAHKRKQKKVKRGPGLLDAIGMRVAADIAKGKLNPDPHENEMITPEPPPPTPGTAKSRITTTRKKEETPDMNMMNNAVEASVTEPRKDQQGPEPAGKAGRAAETQGLARLDQKAVELGIRIGLRVASGEMMKIEITEDMIGKTLILEKGEVFWVDMGASGNQEDAKKVVFRRNGSFNDAIISLLVDLKGEDVPVSLIVDHMIEKGHYKPNSARSSTLRRLKQLAEEGRVSYRNGPGEPVASVR